jgi:chromosome segregation ATPase
MSERKAYEENLETQIKELGAKIDQLQAKLETIETDSNSVIQSSLDELRTERHVLKVALRNLKDSSDSAWEELRNGVENAVNDMKSAIENAISKF